ncbi:hypothetical protein [Myxococcus sp. RHSTA-1-4]|uniref:hypothetical protein n=1 Tax=Myxococcus sp. RHSTA-1-4 TaxID=2874601 RepID=UPI001CBDAE53|nr:hypothetical protein [Myxococcus sp. RHSTA-1-4]MBZ4417546.1 hypothetical protein [Myxococcus sp. RHSTA-1-4]
MRSHSRWLLALLCLCGCSRTSPPSVKPREEGASTTAARSPDAPLSKAALDAVRKRAMYIVDAERAAIGATDLLLAMEERDESKLEFFLTVPRGDTWYGLFGKLDDQGTFVPGYAFRSPRAVPEKMEPMPLSALPADFSAEARAVRTATQRAYATHGRRQLNPVVYAEEGALSVYVLQGFNERGLYVLGGDFRFDFSRDGRKVLEEVALHKSIIPVDLREDSEGQRPEAIVHSHVLFPGPVETEWALLMLYPELNALYVTGLDSRWMYAMHPDGRVRIIDAKREKAVDPE